MLSVLVRDSLRFSLGLALAALAAAGFFGSACVAPPPDVVAKTGEVLDICATAPEGALCDDKNVCTVFDVCKSGVCKGSAAPNGTLCTDGNVCTANDSCRSGACVGDPVPDTTACTDGDPCTVGDVCKSGACVPGTGTLTCDDGIACTLDLCIAGTGCVFAPVGDCSAPKDAGPEAPAPDARPADGRGDATMPGGDAASDRPAMSDAPLADAVGETAPTDTGMTDTRPPLDAPPEPDARTDGLLDAVDAAVDAGDASPVDASPVDASPVDASPVDAPDAADAGVAPPTLPVLRASGGACTCATAETPRSGWTLVLLGVVGVLARRRSRAPRRRA